MSNVKIKSRFTGVVIFETEIAAEYDNSSVGVRLGLAVRAAFKNDADLSGAVLSGAVMSGADLSGAVMSNADLSGAHLRGADLRGAVLRGADLSNADLSGADLSGAVLSGAVMSGAVMSGAKITRIIARVGRLDGYEFIAFHTDKDTIIRAGCRTMSPAEYRAHVAREYPDEPKAEETLAILDYIEARAAKLGVAQ